jgi:hypothetical protein
MKKVKLTITKNGKSKTIYCWEWELGMAYQALKEEGYKVER